MIDLIKNIILKFLKSNYYTDKLLYFSRFKKRFLHEKHTLLIYTMGKVGSTSIYESLKDNIEGFNLVHLHRLNKSYLKKREQFIKNEIYKNNKYSKHLYTDLLWKPECVRQTISNKANELKIITLVREPISRNISLLFQWIDFTETENHYKFESRSKNHPFNIVTNKNDLTPLYNYFFNGFISTSHIEWFESELKEVFNINLDTYSFDKQKGYSILNNSNSNLLVIKLESLSSSFNEAINKFLDIDIQLKNANEADNKQVNEVYKKFKAEIEIPKSYIDSLYETTYMKCFYSEKEINTFKSKWKH